MKKMMKLIFCIVVIVISFNLTANGRTLKPFNDIDLNSWYYSDVSELYNKNMIEGFPDGSFRPDDMIGTDQFLKIVISGLGYYFEHEERYWAEAYIKKAEELLIIEKGEIENFKAPVTRGVISSIISKALDLRGENITLYENTLVDIKGYTPEIYIHHIQKIYSAGIVTGYPDYTYRYDSYLTRAEACAIINRLFTPILRREQKTTSNTTVSAYFFSSENDIYSTDYLTNMSVSLKSKVNPNLYEKIIKCLNVIYDQKGHIVMDYVSTSNARYVNIEYFYDRSFSHNSDYSMFSFRFYDGKTSYPELHWGYDSMFMKLSIKRLWWKDIYDDMPVRAKTFYEYKIRGALCSILEYDVGKKLSDFIINKHNYYLNSDDLKINALENAKVKDIKCIFFTEGSSKVQNFTFSQEQ